MFALLVVAITLLQIPSPSVPEKPVEQDRKPSHKAKHNPKAAPVVTPNASISAPMSQPTGTQQKNEYQRETAKEPYPVKVVSQPFDWLYLLYVIATTVAAFVAWRALVAIKIQGHWMKRQLAEMRVSRKKTVAEMQAAGDQTRQMIEHMQTQVSHLSTLAHAAQKSANAAEETAKRFAQIEGARIVVTIDWIGDLVGKIVRIDDSSAPATGVCVSIKCKNEGRSIGWITRKRLSAAIFQNTIPPDPNFDDTEIIYNGLEKLSPEDESKTDETPQFLGEDGFGKWIIIWGIVTYSDMFSIDRTTTFGYIVTVDEKLKRISLPAYNRYT